MRLAVSNIAWDVAEDNTIAGLLRRYGVDAIDIAPAKYFADPQKVREPDIIKIKRWWSDHGIEITGMQALLFGTTGLNMFGPKDVQCALLSHLDAICHIGHGLGAPRLVFGSPRSRDRSGLTDEQAKAESVAFFRRLGDIAQRHDVVICLEPNPSCYGSNFMTTSRETADVVQFVDHPAIKMQLDTGALSINSEDAKGILASCFRLIGHIHASEPDLKPLGDCHTDHRAISEAIATYLPEHVVSVEMLATTDEPHLVSIERALCSAATFYRPGQGGGA